MSSVLLDLLDPSTLEYEWVQHDETIKLGPFTFSPEMPIPVATNGDNFAASHWLQVPYKPRGPLPTGVDEDKPLVFGNEVIKAFLAGHLNEEAPDMIDLVDHVARALLTVAALKKESQYYESVTELITNCDDAAPLFDNLIRLSSELVKDGAAAADNGEIELALHYLLLARIELNGAHLLSPTTAGVLYDLGMLSFDMAHRFSLSDDVEIEDKWQKQFSGETQYYLQLALSDEEVRDETPAFYLLGVSREVLGDLSGAESAYKRFISSPANQRYPNVGKEVQARIESLRLNSPDISNTDVQDK